VPRPDVGLRVRAALVGRARAEDLLDYSFLAGGPPVLREAVFNLETVMTNLFLRESGERTAKILPAVVLQTRSAAIEEAARVWRLSTDVLPPHSNWRRKGSRLENPRR
jgi:hypothetical protein